MNNIDQNCLSHWFPRIEKCGIQVPRTTFIKIELNLVPLLDGDDVPGFNDFLNHYKAIVEEIGIPCFLRTGQGSGKHSWDRCCYYTGEHTLQDHVFSLIEWSHCVDFIGLQTDCWVAREFLDIGAPFVLPYYGNMPVGMERRYFFRSGKVEHHQPYWPIDAVEQGNPEREDWRELLIDLNREDKEEIDYLTDLTERFVAPCFPGEYWSVDWLQIPGRGWLLTDMALGEQSFKYEP